MATLNVEEQEQLDALKNLWDRWGNWLMTLLIIVMAAYAGYNGWNWWQTRQAGSASVLYAELQNSVDAGQIGHVERVFSDMQSHYGRTTYAAHAGLLAAKAFYADGQVDQAAQALTWVADKAPDEGLQAIARLRLSGIQMQAGDYDAALQTLKGKMPASFDALASDRRGDIYLQQGKRDQAAVEYGKAWQRISSDAPDYRRLIGIKLNALGIKPSEETVSS